jgi:mono/diheme cytochrome c family protein
LTRLPFACLAAALAACQQLPSAETAAPTPQQRGEAFAQASCAGCHAVGRHGLSPNRNAPPFPAIVNQQELTAETLSTWLRDAHNYPRQMQFTLDERGVGDLVAYMLTLRHPNYRPPA